MITGVDQGDHPKSARVIDRFETSGPLVSHPDVAEGAIPAIFDRHVPTVRRFLIGRLKDTTAADDATQETFARALTRLPTLREHDKLVPWLLGIARLVSFEHKRGAARFVPLPVEEELQPAARDPESELAGRQTEQAVSRALLELSRDRREALLMRVEHELGYEEIARSMGWTIPKVKNELHRARLQLRSILALTLCALGLSVWIGGGVLQSVSGPRLDGAFCFDASAELIAQLEAQHGACLIASPAPADAAMCR